jgi:hypothetical protein
MGKTIVILTIKYKTIMETYHAIHHYDLSHVDQKVNWQLCVDIFFFICTWKVL